MLPSANWAGNVVFRASRFHRPTDVSQLQEIVAGSASVRALGTGHSFNTIADTDGDMVSVAGLPRVVDIDSQQATATVSAGLRFGEITDTLHRAGFALHNLGSLPHISIAGACATGTHGSGVTNRCLAAAVRSVELVSATGDLRTIGRDNAAFPGTVLSLGSLGVVTRLTLDLIPAFELRQWVYEDLPTGRLREHFDEVMASAYSVSLFTDWRTDQVNQIWLKSTDPDDAPERLHGAALADNPRHPVPGLGPEPCTAQLGRPGPWHARLPHFRLDHTPSSGDELQSEYFVDRTDALAAFDALDAVRHRISPALQISEIRSVAADDLWLSPAFGRDSIAFHFTWHPDAEAAHEAVRAVEQALEPLNARPHWGKVFRTDPATVRNLYPYFNRFAHLVSQSDPHGKFRNDFTAPFLAAQ